MTEFEERGPTIEIGALKPPEWQEEMPLREALPAAVFSPTVSLDKRVKRLRLGQLDSEARFLLDMSVRDPQKLERYYVVYVKPDWGVIISKHHGKGFVTGNGQASYITLEIAVHKLGLFVPRERRQNRYFATALHSHGGDNLPQSPRDLEPLFSKENSIRIAPLSYVITPQGSWLIFRGEKTSIWYEFKTQQKIAAWEGAIENRTKQFRRMVYYYKDGVSYNAHVQGAFLSQVARKYDLQIFWGSAGEDVGVRKDPNFIVEFYRPKR